MPTALVTGITGQDGSYLAELLLARGYRVVGVARAGDRSPHLDPRVELVAGDLLDQASLDAAVRHAGPDEVYNLAGQSSVARSWDEPVLTGELTGLGAARLLESVRRHAPAARFLQAGSCEVFGDAAECPQRETTPFGPRSPYAAAKAYAQYATASYRDGLGLFAASAILFNHESPRRGEAFVTRKITRGAAAISLGLARELRLGNLDVRRDWGFAGDYVDAMWRILQQPAPDDFVVGTGRLHSVGDFCAAAFACVGLDWREHVVQDPGLFRPADAAALCADASRARARLGWAPTVDFPALVAMMVHADVERLRGA